MLALVQIVAHLRGLEKELNSCLVRAAPTPYEQREIKAALVYLCKARKDLDLLLAHRDKARARSVPLNGLLKELQSLGYFYGAEGKRQLDNDCIGAARYALECVQDGVEEG